MWCVESGFESDWWRLLGYSEASSTRLEAGAVVCRILGYSEASSTRIEAGTVVCRIGI